MEKADALLEGPRCKHERCCHEFLNKYAFLGLL